MIFCMTVAEPDPDADAALEDCIARIAGGDKDVWRICTAAPVLPSTALPCQSSKRPRRRGYSPRRLFAGVERCRRIPQAGPSLWPGC